MRGMAGGQPRRSGWGMEKKTAHKSYSVLACPAGAVYAALWDDASQLHAGAKPRQLRPAAISASAVAIQAYVVGFFLSGRRLRVCTDPSSVL